MKMEKDLDLSVVKDKASEILKILNGFSYGHAKQILNDVYLNALEINAIITICEDYNESNRGSGTINC